MRALAAGLGGGQTLVDVDADGTLELWSSSSAGQRLYRRDARRRVDRRDRRIRPGAAPAGAVAVGVVSADFDNDGRPTCLCSAMAQQPVSERRKGAFHRRHPRSEAAAFAALPGAAAFVDVDHDGDVDLLIAGLPTSRPRGVSVRRAPRFPADSRRRRCSCCATTATAASPTSRAPRSWRGRGSRHRDRPDRFRQPSRSRSGDRE